MKKVKIMLLSLALFAVVGGALAFKAKHTKQYCTTDAYWNGNAQSPVYYCSFDQGGALGITTTSCGLSPILSTTVNALGVQKFCTTPPSPDFTCTDGAGGAIACTIKTTLIAD